MTFKIKGRPKVNYKIRSVNGICPKGFVFHKMSNKKKAVVFKREK